MSIRQHNLGSIVKPGFNALGVQTSVTTYFPYLYAWGGNTSGRLGLGNTTDYSSPKQIGTLTNWLTAAAGYQFTASIKTDGTLWTWGMNFYGQLGLGNSTSYSSPKQVGSLTNWKSLAASANSCFAIQTDGTLWAWGRNHQGQLGLGNTSSYYSSPKQVGALTTWSVVWGGSSSTMAIRTDGTLWAWGENNQGQLGINSTAARSSPTQVGSLTNWAIGSLSNTSQTFAQVIKTDGTLWSWGFNRQGQLGLGNTTYYATVSSPTQVGALTNWYRTSCGDNWAMSRKTDGTLWSWGQNTFGQLGLNNTTSYSSPKQVGSLTNWSQIGTASRSGFGVKTDGTLWSWGVGSQGILALGNTSSYSSPKQVGALTTWLNVAGGSYSAFATLY